MAFNLERRAVKDLLSVLGRELHTLVADVGLVYDVSVEHPALVNQHRVAKQELYFVRPPLVRRDLDRIINRMRGLASIIQDPSPQCSHVCLAVAVEFDHVFAGLKLHRDAAVDHRNLARRLSDSADFDAFLSLLVALPADIEIGVDGQSIPASECERSTLKQFMAALDQPLVPGESRWFQLGHRVERTRAIALGADIGSSIAAAMSALIPVYRFIAWTQANDHLSISSELSRGSQKRPSAPSPGPSPLSKHDRVRIINGLFSGREGVVQEVDGKGILKVLVGSASIKLHTRDVKKSGADST